MKNQKTPLINSITKKKKAGLALGISKLVVCLLLFSSTSIKAQAPTVAPYPAVELGQQMLIDSSDPTWDMAMEQSGITRGQAQAFINNCAGCNPEPESYVSCSGSICCETTAVWCPDHWTWHFITQCWNNGARMDLIEQ